MLFWDTGYLYQGQSDITFTLLTVELLIACCQVKKRNSEESSTQWTTGIAEVQLPIEYACLFNLLINCDLCFGISLLVSLYLEHYHAQFASWKWSACLQGQSLSDLFCINSVTAWCNGHYRRVSEVWLDFLFSINLITVSLVADINWKILRKQRQPKSFYRRKG